MFRTLRDFLAALEDAGELQRVAAPVSPLLEVSAIADRVSTSPAAGVSEHARAFDPGHCDLGGRALLFEHIEGSDFPLAINTFGSYRRMEMALGIDRVGGFDAIASRIASLTKPEPPRSLGAMFTKAREFLPLLRTPPKRVRKGVCQEVVKLTSRSEVDLTRLPLIKCWPLDGDPEAVGYQFSAEQAGTAKGDGRYITFAGMHTIHADDRDVEKPPSHNIGMYRAQLIDETHLAMHWHVHHDGAAHWRSWKRLGEPMPIAIALGGEPVLPYAATAPLPPGLSELLMAGFLNGRGIPMVRCKTVPLWVPANSEIVIEGWVSTECGEIGWDPGRKASRHRGIEASRGQSPDDQVTRSPDDLGPGAVFEGPFGDHTGFYSLPDRYPIVDVTAMTHRRDAVYPTTIVGLPPQEDYYLGKATERIFLPLLQTLIPDIVDYHLPMFGCFHNCAFVQIDKQYALQARRVMHAIWGAGQMAWTKFIVVVDRDVNVHDEVAVLDAMFERCHFGRDLERVNGPLDILDHAAPRLGAGHKLGFDATRTVRGESVNGVAWNAPVPAASQRGMLPFGSGRCAFVHAIHERAEAAVSAHARETGATFIVTVDETVDLTDWEEVFFHWCANCDPGRDLIVMNEHPGAIGFDATPKTPGVGRHGERIRDFPPILQMSDEITQRIESRWSEYGF